ncbi:hypothetical protein ACFX14_012471 [Malus domestica]
MAHSESLSSDSLSDPSLSQNISFSHLNDQAVEFVPSRTPIAPAFAPALSPTAAGQVHIYLLPWPSSPFHVPIQAKLKEYVLTLDSPNFDDTGSKHDFIIVESYALCLLFSAKDQNPYQELTVPLKVDGVLMDAYRLGNRQTFNAAFKKLGLDCASWT